MREQFSAPSFRVVANSALRAQAKSHPNRIFLVPDNRLSALPGAQQHPLAALWPAAKSLVGLIFQTKCAIMVIIQSRMVLCLKLVRIVEAR